MSRLDQADNLVACGVSYETKCKVCLILENLTIDVNVVSSLGNTVQDYIILSPII